eukprot:GFUD01024432.1.p1 GENE.GFUD01024432.1~~GFUD01024432.1.p1  ORF type:complete len:422 (+),score=86.93 GFUD01024432.1:153-1268(+)
MDTYIRAQTLIRKIESMSGNEDRSLVRVLINVLSHSLSLVMAELIKTQEMDVSQLEAIHITGYSQLTQDQIDTITRISRSALVGSKNKAVRLTFHDCVGGCNGCLNVNNPDNKGLEGLVADIETVYQDNNFSEIISRADLWALLGIWSINQTIIANNEDCDNCEEVPELEVTFKWGRKDCATAPYSDNDVGLPAATFGHSELMDFFSDEFDFNDREVTALMGVHTLGAAKIFNSGFHGTWISGGANGASGAVFFNNQYFINMASLDWTLAQRLCTSLSNVDSDLCSNGQTTGWQWNVAGLGFNLNADMALFKDFDTDSDGKPSCTYTTCPPATTTTDVEEFAASNTVWIQEFSKVYTKMLAHGSHQLQDVN